MQALTCRGLFRSLTGNLQGGLADLGATLYHRVLGPAPESNITGLVHCTWTHYLLGEWREAERKLSAAFDVARGYGRWIDYSNLHGLRAILHVSTGRLDEARADVEESVKLSKKADYGSPVFHASIFQAIVEFLLGDHERVVELLAPLRSEAANASRTLLFGPWFLPLLGISFARLGQVDQADQALAALRQVSPTGPLLPMTCRWLEGNILAARNDHDGAAVAYRSALDTYGPGGDPLLHRTLMRRDLGELLLDQGDVENARTELLTAARVFSSLEAEPLLRSCEEMLRTAGSRGVGRPRDAIWQVLTPREKDIVELVGRGWTNKEIADDLFISAETVEYHLRNIFTKCDFRSRKKVRDWYQARQNP